MGAEDSFHINPTVKELTPSSTPVSSPRKYSESESEQTVQIHKRSIKLNPAIDLPRPTRSQPICRDGQCQFGDQSLCQSREIESSISSRTRVTNGAVYQSVSQSTRAPVAEQAVKPCGGLFGFFCSKSDCKSLRLAPVPQFTYAEIRKHNKADDFWTIVDERVYDLTDYLPIHPGTARLLLPLGGLDATDDFIAMRHSAKASEILSSYWIGNVVGSKYREPPANAGLALSEERKAIAHEILKRTATNPPNEIGEAPPRKKLSLRERFELCWYV